MNKLILKKIWTGVNEFVKSPLFVFLFGASIATVYPTIKEYFTPKEELLQQKKLEQAKSDAQLIVPFLANLNTDDPVKFFAAEAALSALEEASKMGKDSASDIFIAVNKAIETVARNLFPRSDFTALTQSDIKQIEADAKPVTKATVDVESAYQNLQSSIVYIQVENDNENKFSVAKKIRELLQSKSVVCPGIEKLSSDKIPRNTQVRYFNDIDGEKAKNLAAIISNKYSIETFVVRPGISAKRGTLEIWIGKN